MPGPLATAVCMLAGVCALLHDGRPCTVIHAAASLKPLRVSSLSVRGMEADCIVFICIYIFPSNICLNDQLKFIIGLAVAYTSQSRCSLKHNKHLIKHASYVCSVIVSTSLK